MKGIKKMPLIRCHFEDGPKFISWKPNQMFLLINRHQQRNKNH